MELLQTNTLQYAREKLLDYLLEKQEIKTLGLMDAERIQILAEDVKSICPIHISDVQLMVMR